MSNSTPRQPGTITVTSTRTLGPVMNQRIEFGTTTIHEWNGVTSVYQNGKLTDQNYPGLVSQLEKDIKSIALPPQNIPDFLQHAGGQSALWAQKYIPPILKTIPLLPFLPDMIRNAPVTVTYDVPLAQLAGLVPLATPGPPAIQQAQALPADGARRG